MKALSMYNYHHHGIKVNKIVFIFVHYAEINLLCIPCATANNHLFIEYQGDMLKLPP